MYTRILTFHNLTLPHLDGNRAEQWCTYSQEDGMVYLLNGDRRELAALIEIDIDKDIHFKTEAECHNQASKYYTNYNQSYPYVKEWQKACIANVVLDSDDVQSQTMEFE